MCACSGRAIPSTTSSGIVRADGLVTTAAGTPAKTTIFTAWYSFVPNFPSSAAESPPRVEQEWQHQSTGKVNKSNFSKHLTHEAWLEVYPPSRPNKNGLRRCYCTGKVFKILLNRTLSGSRRPRQDTSSKRAIFGRCHFTEICQSARSTARGYERPDN